MLSCKFENGHKANLRHAVVDALIIKNNKILLIKRSKTAPVEPNKYAFPGGFMDLNENSKEACLREVFEETGYKAKIKYLFEIIDNPDRNDNNRQNVGFVYAVDLIKKISKEDKNEIAGLFWFDLDNLPNDLGFDHRKIIDRYKKYLKKPYKLPAIIS